MKEIKALLLVEYLRMEFSLYILLWICSSISFCFKSVLNCYYKNKKKNSFMCRLYIILCQCKNTVGCFHVGYFLLWQCFPFWQFSTPWMCLLFDNYLSLGPKWKDAQTMKLRRENRTWTFLQFISIFHGRLVIMFGFRPLLLD